VKESSGDVETSGAEKAAGGKKRSKKI